MVVRGEKLRTMILAYTYKLAPSASQSVEMNRHIEMLRLQFNFRIREREEAYQQASHPIMGNYCDINSKAECCPLTCSVSKNALYGDPWTVDKKTGKAKKRNAKAQQDADLVNLKQQRPWYKSIQHHVLQQMIKRVDDAFGRFFKGLGAYPKPKKRGRFRSFSYPPGDVSFKGNKVRLPGIGWMRFYQSRPFPNGFEVRTVTVKRRADGFYLVVKLRDDSVPSMPTPNVVKTAIGIDLGIKKLASLSNGETITNPQFSRNSERRRQILTRRASRKVKGSRKRKKAYQYLARLEQWVAQQRNDYQWKVARCLVKRADCLIFEDLNIKGMMARCKPKKDAETGKYLHNGQAAKSGLNKALADAAWGELKQKVKILTEKLGVLFHEINPRHTSQECICCGYISPANRNKERFLCESCGFLADADIQAAGNIRERGLKELGISLPLPQVLGKVTPKKPAFNGQGKPLGLPNGSGKPPRYLQLSLLDILECRKAE